MKGLYVHYSTAKGDGGNITPTNREHFSLADWSRSEAVSSRPRKMRKYPDKHIFNIYHLIIIDKLLNREEVPSSITFNLYKLLFI